MIKKQKVQDQWTVAWLRIRREDLAAIKQAALKDGRSMSAFVVRAAIVLAKKGLDIK